VGELNPLTMSQIDIVNSCSGISIINKSANVAEKMSNVTITDAANIAPAAIRPQTDNHRGTSFDLYNTE
jgi:hypothetical protein